MITELSEADATGRIAEIYAEVRQLYATPYVSAIHRHLATRPGVLEWAWEAVSPVFRDGSAQETGWRLAAEARLPSLPAIPNQALNVWGVAAEDFPAIRAACDSFTRAAPVNLMFGGLVRALLAWEGGHAHGRQPEPMGWIPPPMLPPPPAMVDEAALAPQDRAVLNLFRSGTGTTAFIPSLYRMLARWPALLAHLAVELRPLFDAPATTSAAGTLLSAIDHAVTGLLPHLVHAPEWPRPGPVEAAHISSMVGGYRKTSPELILFGRLIRHALPD
ncbi:MAG: hypothetical protein SFW09_10015 [Hyphomicrobiaceae bacterium]|nr:hypothetical protein [Hyphomicrobiaceae bacterium]